jgi:hypothetical protein
MYKIKEIYKNKKNEKVEILETNIYKTIYKINTNIEKEEIKEIDIDELEELIKKYSLKKIVK